MDVHWYFHVQQLFAGSGTGGGLHVEEDLEAMDKLGLPSDCCTLLRLALYYQVAGCCPFPPPTSRSPSPATARRAGTRPSCTIPTGETFPVFAPDPPYHNDDRAIDYYAGEMKRMVDFVTQHTGKTLDMERLKEVVEETNKGYALWMEYNDSPALHRLPTATSCRCRASSRSTRVGAGDPEKTRWYEAMVADAERRVRENRPEVPEPAHPAVLVRHPALLLQRDRLRGCEQEWGGVIAMDMVSYCPYELVDTSSEDSIFRGLAKRAFQDGPMIHQARGKVDNVVHDITRIVKDYNIDCVIFPGHMGHKDMAASTSLMRRRRAATSACPSCTSAWIWPTSATAASTRSRTTSRTSSPRWDWASGTAGVHTWFPTLDPC